MMVGMSMHDLIMYDAHTAYKEGLVSALPGCRSLTQVLSHRAPLRKGWNHVESLSQAGGISSFLLGPVNRWFFLHTSHCSRLFFFGGWIGIMDWDHGLSYTHCNRVFPNPSDLK